MCKFAAVLRSIADFSSELVAHVLLARCGWYIKYNIVIHNAITNDLVLRDLQVSPTFRWACTHQCWPTLPTLRPWWVSQPYPNHLRNCVMFCSRSQLPHMKISVWNSKDKTIQRMTSWFCAHSAEGQWNTLMVLLEGASILGFATSVLLFLTRKFDVPGPNASLTRVEIV